MPEEETKQLDAAIRTIATVCSAFNGTLPQHQEIQEALGVLVKAAKETPIVQPGDLEVLEPEPVGANGDS